MSLLNTWVTANLGVCIESENASNKSRTQLNPMEVPQFLQTETKTSKTVYLVLKLTMHLFCLLFEVVKFLIAKEFHF